MKEDTKNQKKKKTVATPAVVAVAAAPVEEPIPAKETAPVAATPVSQPAPAPVVNPYAASDLKTVIALQTECKNKITALQSELEEESTKLRFLTARMAEVSRETLISFGLTPPQADQMDGRKRIIPEKNLKISAVRAVIHAKEKGRSPEEAFQRAMQVVSDRAKRKYKMKDVPADVEPYIRKRVLEEYGVTAA